MAKQTIESLVEGGKASAGPPLGPALGPMGVNIGDVIARINERTRDMAGMKVPVKVTVDTDTKEFEIEVGTPPMSALIKKELGLPKASQEPGRQRVADLNLEQARKLAKIKFGTDEEPAVNQVRGTARSMGISVGEGRVTEEEKKAYEEAKAVEEVEEKPEEETGETEKGKPPEETPSEGKQDKREQDSS
jgi:large subunit ribosomal protein L11